MRIPVIRVKDNGRNGEVHIVGTNSHDCLVVDKHQLTYYNLQNGCGSQFSDPYGYEFDFEENSWDLPRIQFVTLEEFIKLSMEDIDEQAKGLIEFYKAYKAGVFDKVQEAREDAGITYDSAGNIID